MYVQEWEADNPKTHQGLNVDNLPTSEVFKHFGLSDDTIDFVGHALALHRDDDYISKPGETLSKGLSSMWIH